MTTLEITLIALVIILLIVLVGVGVALILVVKRLLWVLAKFTVFSEMVDRMVEKVATFLPQRKPKV